MIKLYGLRMSNYYSLVKAAMIEKGLDFEEVKAPPTQKEDNLARSPMGKMPSIEIDGQYISESLAIVSYLERAYPATSLLPADPLEAAKALELTLHIKLDVELAARRLLPAAMFGGSASDELIETTRQEVNRGMQAVSQLMVCNPMRQERSSDLPIYIPITAWGWHRPLDKKCSEQSCLPITRRSAN